MCVQRKIQFCKEKNRTSQTHIFFSVHVCVMTHAYVEQVRDILPYVCAAQNWVLKKQKIATTDLFVLGRSMGTGDFFFINFFLSSDYTNSFAKGVP